MGPWSGWSRSLRLARLESQRLMPKQAPPRHRENKARSGPRSCLHLLHLGCLLVRVALWSLIADRRSVVWKGICCLAAANADDDVNDDDTEMITIARVLNANRRSFNLIKSYLYSSHFHFHIASQMSPLSQGVSVAISVCFSSYGQGKKSFVCEGALRVSCPTNTWPDERTSRTASQNQLWKNYQ